MTATFTVTMGPPPPLPPEPPEPPDPPEPPVPPPVPPVPPLPPEPLVLVVVLGLEVLPPQETIPAASTSVSVITRKPRMITAALTLRRPIANIVMEIRQNAASAIPHAIGLP